MTELRHRGEPGPRLRGAYRSLALTTQRHRLVGRVTAFSLRVSERDIKPRSAPGRPDRIGPNLQLALIMFFVHAVGMARVTKRLRPVGQVAAPPQPEA